MAIMEKTMYRVNESLTPSSVLPPSSDVIRSSVAPERACTPRAAMEMLDAENTTSALPITITITLTLTLWPTTAH